MANQASTVLADAVPLLEKAAPAIAAGVGGPLAGTAVTFLEKAFGLAPGAGAQAVATVLASATPDQIAAMKKADSDFALAMRQLDISLDKQDDDDRASARTREMTLKDRTPAILAYALTAGLFGFIILLIRNSVPYDSQQPLNLTLGSMATAWVAMISYYFGSSHGSQAKDVMLYNSVPSAAGGAR
jgi:hypothetical protein